MDRAHVGDVEQHAEPVEVGVQAVAGQLDDLERLLDALEREVLRLAAEQRAVVVFPVPPFWERTAIVWAAMAQDYGAPGGRGGPAAPPGHLGPSPPQVAGQPPDVWVSPRPPAPGSPSRFPRRRPSRNAGGSA